MAVVTLPYAQDVFQVGSQLRGEWLMVLGLALVPVTVIELTKVGRRMLPSRMAA